MTASPLLRVNKLSVSYAVGKQRQTVVQDASFSIQNGETVALVGATGSGKSTLARALLDINPPEAYTTFESIELQGVEKINKRKQLHALRGNTISMLFQEPSAFLNPVMTCGKQIEEVLQPSRELPRKGVHLQIKEALADIGLADPERIMKAYPGQLSGGECQRVMLVMATLQEPRVLIADEPTSAVDQDTLQKLTRAFARLTQKGTGILLITHDLALAMQHADRIVVMQCGQVVDNVPADNIQDATHPYTRQLLASHYSLQEKKSAPPKEPEALPLVEVDRLSLSYAESAGRLLFWAQPKTVLQDISFKLHQGHTLGILGESGSGKTSLAACLTGTVNPTGGSIVYSGEIATRSDVQLVFQHPRLALDPKQKVGKAVQEIVNVNASRHPAGDTWLITQALFDSVNLSRHLMARLPEHLSGGENQRVCIARALAARPKLIVFDEAVSSLDASVKADILTLLKDLRNKLNLTYIFISHDPAVIKFVADRVLEIHNGKIIKQYNTHIPHQLSG